MPTDNVIIRLENVGRTYEVGETQVHALREVDASIKRGEMIAIMGPSGSGKSTLMNILGCLDKPTEGRYSLEGVEVSTLQKNDLARVRNGRIGFVFQSFNLLARTTALENTELPLLYAPHISSAEAREKALQALSLVGLQGREHHKPSQLSGGEQQRVAIARSLVNNPSLLLADEPTGNLDSRTGAEIMKTFIRLNREKNITIILVTHDPDVAAAAGRKIHLKDGRVVREERN
jgi:putative ABC transport system ATP-binding protein